MTDAANTPTGTSKDAPATAAGPHICPECRHWHDPDAPLIAPEAEVAAPTPTNNTNPLPIPEYRNTNAQAAAPTPRSAEPLNVALRHLRRVWDNDEGAPEIYEAVREVLAAARPEAER